MESPGVGCSRLRGEIQTRSLAVREPQDIFRPSPWKVKGRRLSTMGSHRRGVVCILLICSVLLAVLAASAPMFAQTPTSTILGVVKDPTGGTVPGAIVTVTNTDTGIARTATTGEDGAYRFPALNVGNYQVQVMKDGFQTAERTGITLEVAQSAEIDMTLQLGAVGEKVVVTGEAPLVQTTSSTGGGLVDEQQVSNLPINGRNLINLTLMQAGISQTTVLPIQTQTDRRNPHRQRRGTPFQQRLARRSEPTKLLGAKWLVDPRYNAGGGWGPGIQSGNDPARRRIWPPDGRAIDHCEQGRHEPVAWRRV